VDTAAKYSATIIANSILQRFMLNGKKITPMKLQKLMYIIFKEYYTEYRILLFNDPIEAWQYGPVVRSVYDEFKSFESDSIDKYATDAKGIAYVVDEEKDLELKEIMDKVIIKFYSKTGIELSELTHENTNSAWMKAYNSKNEIMNLEDIKNESSYISN